MRGLFRVRNVKLCEAARLRAGGSCQAACLRAVFTPSQPDPGQQIDEVKTMSEQAETFRAAIKTEAARLGFEVAHCDLRRCPALQCRLYYVA